MIRMFTFKAGMLFCAFLMCCLAGKSQQQFSVPTRVYLMHSSGLHLKMGDGRSGRLESANASNPQQVTLIPDGLQAFTIETIDWPYCKIVSATEPQYAMELVSEKTAAGTSVKLWPYDDGTAPTRRQWMLVPMPAAGHDDTSVMATRTDEKTLPNPADGIYSISGSRLHAGAGNAALVRSLPRGVYVERIQGTTRKFVVR